MALIITLFVADFLFGVIVGLIIAEYILNNKDK